MNFIIIMLRPINNFTKKIYILLFSILTTCCMLSYGEYLYQIQTEYKGGSRSIGRISILAPIWQSSTQIVHLDGIGMLANESSKELNIGGGYRHLFKLFSHSIIAGSYLFTDVKETPNKNTAYQLTGGIEILSTIGEIRFNGYIPVSKQEILVKTDSGVVHDGANIYFGDKDKIERSLGGYDVEIGYKIPVIPVNAYGAFYHFSKDNIKINGGRFRVEYKPFKWLFTGGEYSYDKERKSNWYLNLGIRLDLLSLNPDKYSPFSIKGKMTQIPIRDIDIVTVERDELRLDARLATQVTTESELRNAILSGKKSIAITKDIDLGNQIIGFQYSSPKEPMEGFKIAGVLVEREGSEIQKVSYHQMKLYNYKVQQQSSAPVLVSVNGNNVKLAGALFPYIIDTEISYLTLENWEVVASSGGGSGLVGYAKNSHIHNITNKSNMPSKETSGVVWYATGSSIIENNINSGNLSNEDTYGIAFVLSDSSILRKNINSGNIAGLYSSGIVRLALGSSIIENNLNTGTIAGLRSSGIVAEAYNNSVLRNNVNRADLTGRETAGIVKLGNNSVHIEKNNNSGNITNQLSGGIAYILLSNVEMKNNHNSGSISGQSAAGIAVETRNSVTITKNSNEGIISGQDASGIIFRLRDNPAFFGNDNIGKLTGVNARGLVTDNVAGVSLSNNSTI